MALAGILWGPSVVSGSGTCGVPVGTELVPVTSDCLHILKTAVGAATCRNCVCDVDSSGSFDATDGLACIRKAVGIGVELVCPPCCGDGIIESPEECDDGGAEDGDGCSAFCTLEDERGLCAGIDAAEGDELAVQLVSDALDRPVHAAAPPLDPRRLVVVEQPGRIRLIKDGALVPQPFLNIHEKVSCCVEQGLLSLAFHPDFENNRRFFVNYTDNDGATVIERYEVSADNPDVTDPDSGVVLLTIPQPRGNHNGGQVAFRSDGYLYVGMGDGGGGGDPFETGQADSTVLGKMLRLDVDVDDEPYYAVPPSNPGKDAGDLLGLIWAKGLRNPWRFSFDRANGDLYIADVGQNLWEEISYEAAGGSGGLNFGWDIFEGDGHCYEPAPDPDCPDPPTGFTMPVLDYGHRQGCSITGGFVYRGCAIPERHGEYFYSDYCSPFVKTLRVVNEMVAEQDDVTASLKPAQGLDMETISSFAEDARGELYVLDHLDGEMFKIVPAP